MASAVFIYQDDKLQYVNPALEEITGYDKDELLEMRYGTSCTRTVRRW
jgi:PAS domain S-box-containing protein